MQTEFITTVAWCVMDSTLNPTQSDRNRMVTVRVSNHMHVPLKAPERIRRCPSSSVKEALASVLEDVGGVMNARSAGFLPKSRE